MNRASVHYWYSNEKKLKNCSSEECLNSNYLYVMTKIDNIYNRAQFTELLIHVLAMNYDKIAVRYTVAL